MVLLQMSANLTGKEGEKLAVGAAVHVLVASGRYLDAGREVLPTLGGASLSNQLPIGLRNLVHQLLPWLKAHLPVA